MNRNLFWKFLFIVFVVSWSIWETYPPTPRNLIDEFERQAASRDTNFTAIVQQARQLDQQKPDRTFANLLAAIGTNDITRYFKGVIVKAEKNPTQVVLHKLQLEAAGRVRLGLDLQGGSSYLCMLDTAKVDTNKVSRMEEKEAAISQAIEVLRKRVDKMGVAEPILQPVGSDHILIQLPGLSEGAKEDAKNQIKTAAFLEFRMVHPESKSYTDEGRMAAGYELKMYKRQLPDSQEEVFPYLVKKKPEKGLTGNYVKKAYPVPDPITNQPEIALTFNSQGAEIFAEITKENVGKQLAIILDGELYSAPVIQTPILDGNARITGQFTVKEAMELARVLENPLEFPVQIVQEYSVEPSLGKDSIASGLRASIIGTILVAGFMLVYYLFAGVVANVALLLNIIILMGVMCSVETTLTLPGIAGIVLTIGMAVDANVLIFERIREELSAGKSMRGALSAGYDKAFGTIFDSNLTTLISSVILIFMGTGPVKGFGVALTIGISVSMFTALVVTRLIFDWLLVRGWLKRMKMLHFFEEPKIDFLKWSKLAFALSWALALIGMGYGVYRGKQTLGVDFAGGDRTAFSFAQKVEVGQLRSAIDKLEVGEPMIQYQKDMVTGKEVLQVTTKFESADKVVKALQDQFPQAKLKKEGTESIGATVGTQILKTAIVAMLLSLFGILVYVAMRYEFSFAFGAVVAIVHDILMTVGWFCLTGRQFSATMVAAILTIIGFSINDTIVIFDRIREDLKLGLRGTFKDVMNKALNQTLSRTIITSGTVFLATSALYVFGGSVINDFAFTFLVGILTGTYSSIYIASALVLWWHKGERPKNAAQVTVEDTVAARV